MTSEDIRLKVRCGACHGPLSRTLNVVDIGRKATWTFPTGGNVLTGEKGVAVAFLCDACINTKRPIVEAVEFAHAGDSPVYHPVEGLAEINDDTLPDVIIACYPFDQAELRKLGMPLFTPRPGFTLTDCEVCGGPMWIGPRQETKRRERPCMVVCMPCSVKRGAKAENVQHLGG